MKSNNELPITKEIINSPFNLYYLYATLRETMEWYETNMNSGITNFSIDTTKRSIVPELHSISGRTYANFYRSVKKFLDEGIMRSDYVCLMPVTTWDTLINRCREIADVKERTTTIRIFLYIYFYSMWTTQGYSHSRDQMINELRIQGTRLSTALNWLESQGLIVRTNYDKTHGLARIYDIPQDLWTEQRIRFEQNREKTRKLGIKNAEKSGFC